jgi:hypothetical protein
MQKRSQPRFVTASCHAPWLSQALGCVKTIGLLAPAGTPIGIIEQIAQATRTAVAEPAYKQQSLAADVALWAPVVKALGLKID